MILVYPETHEPLPADDRWEVVDEEQGAPGPDDPWALGAYLADSGPGYNYCGTPPFIAGGEDAVLAVGIANSLLNSKGLQFWQAMACTDRRYQRENIPYSPDWKVLYKEPPVLKAPASCMSDGVVIPKHKFTESTDRLARVMPPRYMWIEEERAYGECVELSGVVRGGELGDEPDIEWFPTLLQRWDSDHRSITKYFRYEPTDERNNHERQWRHMVQCAIVGLSLSYTGFCIEIRGDKIIEVNARPGHEPDKSKGYEELLGGNPVQMMMEALCRT